MQRLRPLILILIFLGLPACNGNDLQWTESRVRIDFDTALNANTGWADSAGGTTVLADRPFRIRFEVEAADSGGQVGLQFRRNGGAWAPLLARDFPYPDEISTPPASIVFTEAWPAGALTNDLLEISEMAFAGGAGLGLDSLSNPLPAGQSEWEWGVVIRRWADGPEMMEEGDRFDFRLVDVAGRPLPGREPVTVGLQVPEGHLGGTYPETPGRLGPWQSSDGRLWFPMEPAETYNVLMMLVSDDGGRTWVEADGSHRPGTDDLEGFATAFHSGTIHILHQISEAVVYHAFATSDAPDGAEGWTVRDEMVARPPEPPVQAASLEALSDGTLVAVFASGTRLEVRTKPPEGEWTATDTLVGRPGEGWILSGPQTTVTPDDLVHLAWTETNGSTGRVRHGVVGGDGSVGSVETVATDLSGTEADVGSVAPLAYLPPTGQVAVVWRRTDGRLSQRRIGPGGQWSPAVTLTERTVKQNAVDSDQVGADLIELGDRLHLLFLDQESGSIHHVQTDETGGWTSALPVVTGIQGQWVRGRPVRKVGGTVVYGFVYDAGSDGGSGMNRYGEVEQR
jgi:hypothetical protein